MTELNAGTGRASFASQDDLAGLVRAMSAAVAAWLDGLTSSQQQLAAWPFADPERGDWHYAPRQRNGLALKAMEPRQQAAAYAIIESTLSPAGHDRARAIMALESVLDELEHGIRRRDPLNYAFTVFGDPRRFPWGWRIEGHHLIINATIAGPAMATITPTFWGSNPARIPHGPRAGERVQEKEYRLALELARSLSPAQRELAVVGDRSVGNIITERGSARLLDRPTGLGFSSLADGQRDLAMALIETYVGLAADPLGKPYLARVRDDGLEHLHLAWAGAIAEGEAFYYRLHAPRLLIEFDCSQNDANHIHSLWRDPTNDWGRDILGDHYREHHDHD